MTWHYSLDRDTRGNLGYRIDSDDVSLIAWFPVGENAEDAQQNAKLACDAVNAVLSSQNGTEGDR